MLRGTCCGSVGDEWRATTIWFPTRNWIFLFTDASQKLCCQQYPVRLVRTLCPGLNLLHTSLRPLSKSWICGVLSSRRLYFTMWYWEICFFYCTHCSFYSTQVCCVWCYNVLGNSVNREQPIFKKNFGLKIWWWLIFQFCTLIRCCVVWRQSCFPASHEGRRFRWVVSFSHWPPFLWRKHPLIIRLGGPHPVMGFWGRSYYLLLPASSHDCSLVKFVPLSLYRLRCSFCCTT